jgi:diketogulonate reductase-like aldo/keto reductase
MVGRAIRTSDINRDSLFATTKPFIREPSEDGARAAPEPSLGRLGLAYAPNPTTLPIYR